MIIILTGNGKGKTSAAIGTALRSIYRKKKVVIVQFLKTGFSGEIQLLKKQLSIQLCDYVTIHSFGKKTFTNPQKLTKEDFTIVNKALKFTLKSLDQKPFLIILDEILVTLKFKLTKESQILNIIKQCNNNNIHLILTGRGATKKLIEAADLVTEMKKVKHPFDKGIEAIKGLDF